MLSDLLAQPEGRAPLRRASQRPDPHQIEHPVHVTRRDEMHRAAHRPRAHCLTPLQRRGHLVDRESGQPNPERPQAAGQISQPAARPLAQQQARHTQGQRLPSGHLHHHRLLTTMYGRGTTFNLGGRHSPSPMAASRLIARAIRSPQPRSTSSTGRSRPWRATSGMSVGQPHDDRISDDARPGLDDRFQGVSDRTRSGIA